MKKTALLATVLMLVTAFLNTGIMGFTPKALAEGSDILTLSAPFKQALINAGVDNNPADGNITQSEMAAPTSLTISDYNITDISGIEYATGLTSLSVSGTGITSLPAGFSNLTNLQNLDLSNNNFSVFPAALCGMANLKTLDLKLNSISTLPSGIDGMTGLKDLTLYENGLTSLPSSIGNLAHLEGLYLQRNNLSSLPDSIGNLSNLKELTIWENNLTSFPGSIANLTALQTLDANYNYLDPQAGSPDRAVIDAVILNGTAVTYANQNSYTVSLNPNGGSVNAQLKPKYYYGESLTLPSASKTGFAFSGWDINGDGQWEKKAGDTVAVQPSPVTASSVEYKAVYGYTVTFRAQPYGKINGGTADIPICVNTGEKVPSGSIPEASADEGYVSLGWYDGDNKVSVDDITGMAINANKTFTARFEAAGTVHFPDAAFKAALTAAGADENSDGFITETEMSHRKTLMLSGGQFTDLSGIGYATGLESLTLGAGKVAILPDELFDLTTLTKLDISGNPIPTLPSKIQSLTALRELDANGDGLTALPGWLDTLTNLETLDIGGNKLGAFPTVLEGMAGLKSLDISGNLLIDLPSGCFSSMAALASLDLSGNWFNPENLSAGVPAFAAVIPQNTYAITLDFNRGDGEKLPKTGYGRGETIPLPTATRKAYTFIGWDINGDGTADTDGKGSDTLTPVPPDSISAKTYTAIYECNNARLTGLGLTAGAVISPDFDTDTLAYDVYLPDTVSSVTLTPAPVFGCTFTMDGDAVPSETMQLPLGGEASVTILCTEAGKNQDIYTVDIYRVAPVTAIAVTGGALSPAFAVKTFNYSISLPVTAAGVTLAPQTSASCKSMTIDGDALMTKLISPNPGCKITCVIRAVAANGAVFTYNISVSRAALLSGVKLSAGTMTPATFSPDVTDYTIDVAATVTQVTITPAKTASAKYILIDGKKATSKSVKPPVGGSVKVSVAPVASDGKTKAPYTFTVRRAPLVAAIGVTGFTLDFSPEKASYVVDIPADVDSATVTATAASGAKPLTINGVAQASKTFLLPQPGSSATATVVGVSTNGKVKSTYTVTVRRAPIVSGIQVAGGTLSPAFNATNPTYTVNIPATATSVLLTPKKGADCTDLTINGDDTVAAITVNPRVGESVPVTIVGSTALNTSTYTVHVNRAALVTSIASGTKGYALNAAFTPTTMRYTIHLPYNVSSAVVKATKAKGVKTLSIGGKKATSFTASPPVGGSVDVAVTAATSDKAGSASVTYHVIVTRDALLSGIEVTGGGSAALTPAFDPTKSAYTIDLPAGVDSVTVQPDAVAANVLSVTIDGVVQASKAVTPPEGGSVTVTITATGKDGKTKSTYTVTVGKAATS